MKIFDDKTDVSGSKFKIGDAVVTCYGESSEERIGRVTAIRGYRSVAGQITYEVSFDEPVMHSASSDSRMLILYENEIYLLTADAVARNMAR